MGLKNGDLANCIKSDVSIDEYEPKAGQSEEIIVVGMYGNDDLSVKDLEDFITKGTIGIIDVDVSPNPNEEGNFMVFIEMPRDNKFPNQLRSLLRDVENLTGRQAWSVSPYLSDDTFMLDDPRWESFVMVSPDEVVAKADFDMPDLDDLDGEMEQENELGIEEAVKHIFSTTMVDVLTLNENDLTIRVNGRRLSMKVLDYGLTEEVQARNYTMLKESMYLLKPDIAQRSFTQIMEMAHSVTMLNTCHHVEDTRHDFVVLFSNVEYAQP